MANVYLGLGSNIDAERNLRMGVRELRARFGQLVVSPTYRSEAAGFAGPDFLNLVVGLESQACPREIQAHIEAIHRLAGRPRERSRLASRPLDIDLLLYDDLIRNTRGSELPSDDILEYSFVLRPLADIEPRLVHPVTGRTMIEHWQEFEAARHPLTCVDLIL